MKTRLPAFKPIAIVGGGLSALAVANALGDAVRDTVLVTESIAPDIEASFGMVRCGPALHPARLAAGHGDDVVAAVLSACRRNREILRSWPAIGWRDCASYRCPVDAVEWEEMRQSLPHYRAAGIAVAESAPPGFGGAPRFEHAMHHAFDGVVDAPALARALLAHARDRGLSVCEGVRVDHVRDDAGVSISTAQGELRAEIAILATEAELPGLAAFCRFKLVPMRVQALEAMCARGFEAAFWSAARGYEIGRVHADGRIWVSGSRALPVREELGTRRETTDVVQALLEHELRSWDGFAGWRVHRRWAGVQSVSCDALPLAGAIPGRPRLLVAGGFGMEGLGLTLAAAEVIAELVRRGRARHAAAFAPRRFA
jgi:glycine/D-amino acid oxidase-like deaminating enzyme